MKRLLILFFVILFCYPNQVYSQKLFINSPELAHLEKIKKIKNKKGKVNKYGKIYIGQKGLMGMVL